MDTLTLTLKIAFAGCLVIRFIIWSATEVLSFSRVIWSWEVIPLVTILAFVMALVSQKKQAEESHASEEGMV